jgi:Mn-dependent DtxR family transcriptional regulator
MTCVHIAHAVGDLCSIVVDIADEVSVYSVNLVYSCPTRICRENWVASVQTGKTRELEAAFREAGLPLAEAEGDRVRIRLPDAELVIHPVSAGHGRPQEARDAVMRIRQSDLRLAPVALVAAHFTTGALELLQRERVNYLDDCHFVFRNDVPFVAIDRQRPCGQARKTAREPGLGGRIGIAIQEMLLGKVEWWGVTELADAAKVAPGTAQAALKRLDALDLVDVEGSGPNKRRRLRERGAVLDAWTPHARRERHRLVATFVLGQGPIDLARQVSQRLAEGRIAHAVTGACAALLVAPHVTDVRTCEVWVDPAISEGLVIGALGATPVEKGGNVIVLRAKTDAPLFASREAEGTVVANPLRLYADLLEDPRRGEEQATFLRETVLGY